MEYGQYMVNIDRQVTPNQILPHKAMDRLWVTVTLTSDLFPPNSYQTTLESMKICTISEEMSMNLTDFHELF